MHQWVRFHIFLYDHTYSSWHLAIMNEPMKFSDDTQFINYMENMEMNHGSSGMTQCVLITEFKLISFSVFLTTK